MSPETKVFYLREKADVEEPRAQAQVCGSSGLASTLSWSSLPGLHWVVRGGGQSQRAAWATIWLLLVTLSVIICLLTILSLSGEGCEGRNNEIFPIFLCS